MLRNCSPTLFRHQCCRYFKLKNNPLRPVVVVQSSIPAVGWLRQVDLYEFEPSLLYRVSPRPVKDSK